MKQRARRRPAPCRPTPATTPRRAVFGMLIHRSEKMNSAGGDEIAGLREVIDRAHLAAALLPEHLQHAIGDEEAAHDVGHRRDDGDGAEDGADTRCFSSPAMMIEPTTAIAEIALVSDISGVCSRRRDALDDLESRRTSPA